MTLLKRRIRIALIIFMLGMGAWVAGHDLFLGITQMAAMSVLLSINLVEAKP